ncbi:Kinase [Hexamita inflata]|uniref:Kinase n=1 Tax=Hexamita inflata TaxID=28002 RepID=A0AA86RG37_9EUKA|nr:Kinase [Hexamita inflata]
MTSYYPPPVLTNPATQESYEIASEIGVGRFGSVYRVTTNEGEFAAKVIPIDLLHQNAQALLPREFEFTLNELENGCQQIIKFYDAFWFQDQNTRVAVHVMELGMCNLEEAKSCVQTSAQIKNIYFQIRSGLDYMHSKRILHRDLKEANILVMNENFDIKIIDFGFCKQLEQNTTNTQLGSKEYMHPKILKNEPYGPECDLYSLGVILRNLLKNIKTPDSDYFEMDMISQILLAVQ